MRKVSLRTFIALLTAALMLSTACSNSENPGSSIIEPPDAAGNPVDAFGVIKPAGIQVISVGFPAKLSRIDVTEGQRVGQGDTLAALETDEFKNGLDACEAEISRLERDLKIFREKRKENAGMLAQGKLPDMERLANSLEESSSSLLGARKSLEYKESLLSSGSIPQSELEEAKALVSLRKSTARDTELQLESLKAAKNAELKDLDAEITAIEDKIAAQNSELAAMRKKLSSDFLRGDEIVCGKGRWVVSKVYCSEGMSVSPAEKIMELIDISSLVVEANVDEQFISAVKTGARVTIVPEADRSLLYVGRVSFIASLAVTSNGETTIPVRIGIDDADSFLMPGLNVAVKIEAK